MKEQAGSPRPAIVLSGFFGRGNCGDEAILQAQYERLAPQFEIVVSVDERGAYDGFWNWYPYDRCRIVHQANLGVVAEAGVVGIHVGGGGLPHGFNAAQVVHARSVGKLAILTGVDSPPLHSPAAAEAMRRYLSLFGHVSVRSAEAWMGMSALVPRCHHGADWAVGLPTDGAARPRRADEVLVTIREFPAELVTRRYVDAIAELVARLSGLHERVVLLPFCPEDERFLDRLPVAARLPREVHWWNPRRMQQCIAGASRMVSVGRLHPLVFAANVGTPAAFVEPLGHEPRWPACIKARQLCAEHGWPLYASVPGLIAALGTQAAGWQPAGFAPGTGERWRGMADAIADRFGRAAGGEGIGSRGGIGQAA